MFHDFVLHQYVSRWLTVLRRLRQKVRTTKSFTAKWPHGEVSSWQFVLTSNRPHGESSSRRIVLTVNCPQGDLSSRRIVLTVKCSHSEVSLWRSVLTVKCPYSEVSLRWSVLMVKCPYYEVSVLRSVCATKCPSAKCPAPSLYGLQQLINRLCCLLTELGLTIDWDKYAYILFKKHRNLTLNCIYPSF